ncbi:hypothetical protein JQS43_09365 [Natronosporangium hydrolyticum]|uniref:NurA domain-containing protein n=1 Tax=Natronosporangium hydrolyticum TaxID=2811111 RepID=A0A895YMM7_9ACTN|nr:hypothetical protein JQS43_09365 [Natronosporangium hydrolyticum]
MWVDAWDPAYLDGADAGPATPSNADLELDVELPPDQWRALPPPPDLLAPEHVLLVDGVRRRDAVVWTADADGPHPGLAASYAAGVVHCDLGRGAATLLTATVERGIFTTSPTAPPITWGQIHYPVHRVDSGELPQLDGVAQQSLTELEIRVAERARDQVADPGDLLVLDGPLRQRGHLPRAVGYVKSHRSQYLPADQNQVVTGLAPGQRSPVFRGTNWRLYTWYLRLPGASGAPWSGLARVECSPQLSPSAAVALADLSAVTLPRFAASAYKDSRAPQNLVPIAGLEQRLRARLGDRALLRRGLTRAAALARGGAAGR